MMKHKAFLIVLVVFIACLIPTYMMAGRASVSLPADFAVSDVTTELSLPVDMAFLPSGSIFVAEKGTQNTADIYLIRDGTLIETPVVTVGTNTYGDCGVSSLVLDPNFGQNHFFYVWHSTSEYSTDWSGESVLRLTRFTFNPLTERVKSGSETIILDDVPWSAFHCGGAMGFADDGTLILAVGDLIQYDVAQDPTSLNGKVLRIRPTDDGYEIPADNPFVDDPNVRDEIFGFGVRNPFRMVRRPSDGALLFTDVGENTWEEVNVADASANYGWPIREGPCPIGQRQPCQPASDMYTDPIYAYEHPQTGDVGSGITGVAFYEGNRFPDEYHDALFFADINRQVIATTPLTGSATYSPDHESSEQLHLFAEEAGALVDLAYHDDAIYALDIYSGRLLRIYYAGPDNQTPTADIEAGTALGPAPLTVTFSGTESTVPEGSVPTFHWAFGDGVTATTSTPVVSHTYTADGNYRAELRVTDDADNTSAPAVVDIMAYSGELPKIELTNLTAPQRTNYHGGDVILYQASRSTTSDLDADTPYTWRIDLHHNEHAHPFIVDQATVSDTYEITDESHGGSANVWYEFTLTMHTSSGIAVSQQTALHPARVDVTTTTDPHLSRARLTIDCVVRTPPYTFTSIAGVKHSLEVPSNLLSDGGVYTFDTWQLANTSQSNGVTVTLVVPPEAVTATAQYTYVRPATRILFPLVQR